jgi:hypothetical protein
MNKIKILLVSPAFWLGVGVFIYAGLEAISPSLGGSLGIIIKALLAGFAAIMHSTEIQVAGRTGMLGSRKI